MAGAGPGERRLREIAQRPEIAPEAVEYQSEAVAIALEPPPLAARYLLFAVAGLLTTALVWAAFATIDRVVSAPGKLVASEGTVVVQPLETSVIRELPVRVGQRVAAGTPVAVLDPTFARADAAALAAERRALEARALRLQAERAGDASFAAAVGGDGAELTRERAIFQDRRREFEAQLSVFATRDAEIANRIARFEAELRTARDRERIAGERAAIRKSLYERQIGSRLQYLDAENERLAAAQTAATLAREKQAGELERERVLAEAAAFEEGWRLEAAEAERVTASELLRVSAAAEKAARRSELVVLSAPMDAIVLERASLSPGSVAEAAQPLVTLIPADAALHADVAIPAADIGLVKAGDTARVKLAAFPFQRYGVLEGTVESIAPDAQPANPDGTGGRVYRAKIALGAGRFAAMPADARLSPGMEAVAEIQAGERTVLSYVAYPLIRMADEGAREPR